MTTEYYARPTITNYQRRIAQHRRTSPKKSIKPRTNPESSPRNAKNRPRTRKVAHEREKSRTNSEKSRMNAESRARTRVAHQQRQVAHERRKSSPDTVKSPLNAESRT